MVNAKKHQKLYRQNHMGEYAIEYYHEFICDIANFYLRWRSDDKMLHNEPEMFGVNCLLPFLHYLNPEIFDIEYKNFNLITIDDKDLLYEFYIYIKNFLLNNKVNVMYVDLSDDIFNNYFYIFKIFEDVKKYDVALFFNITYDMYNFFLEYGLEKCITNVSFFLNADESYEILHNNHHDILKHVKIDYSTFTTELEYDTDNFLFNKHHKVGFELYDNLKEWKKEVTAATRNDPEYRKMKKRVRQRDNNTCQCCGYHSDKKKNHKLEVHHIYGYKDHLDYRVEDSNCVLLCKDCHKQYHTIYGKKDVNPVSFMQFIRDYNDFHQKDVQSKLM